MVEHAEALAPQLAGFGAGLALPSRLAPVVNDLYARGSDVVTVGDLGRYSVDESPARTARTLRRCGWLAPLRSRGAWSVTFVMPPPHFESFVELRARLATHPETPAAIAGKSVAQVRQWLRRGTAATIGCPAGYKVPRCLSDYRVCRWEPRLAVDDMWGLPVWKPETLVVFMAARPSQFVWEDIADWLWELCDSLDEALLVGELERRPRSMWMKAAYLIDEGERPELAEALLAGAPQQPTGPYVLGHREKRAGRLACAPAWSQKFQVTDYLLPAHRAPRW